MGTDFDFLQLRTIRPGPELVGVLTALDPMPRSGLDANGLPEALPDAADQVVIAQAWQRVIAWADARLNAAILDVAGRSAEADEEDWGREEVAAALRMSNAGAADRIDVARALSGRRFLTGRALAEGRITYRHAAEIANGLQPLEDDDLAAEAEARLLDAASKKTPAQTATRARKEVIKADPEGADKRAKRARTGRRVDFLPLPDAMTELRAFLPAEGAARIRIALNQLAGRSRFAGDKRTIDQRRADALVALSELGLLAADQRAWLPETTSPDGRPSDASGAPPPGADPTGTDTDTDTDDPDPGAASDAFLRRWARAVRAIVTGRRAAPPRVALVAPLSTALRGTHEPGDLTGYGPVPPSIVRELAGDGRWEKWLADRRGVVADLGRSVYRPSTSLAALVRANYPTCMFPGCSQPSYRCDLDHNVRRIDGGTTGRANLVPLCRRHHRAKDEAGWQIDHDVEQRTCTWISPAGHSYTVQAPGYDVETSPFDCSDRDDPVSPSLASVVAAPVATSDVDDDPPPF
ncbi:HNH endonuclease signature motif containing protein [Cryptosporangium minutisporangium]|uniref:HNH nuclease domain-containing protein n=1 Tax=Cryptosporangium minutisporangium TaxID=113569 RepID=A0ABP6SX17_9ACTN